MLNFIIFLSLKTKSYFYPNNIYRLFITFPLWLNIIPFLRILIENYYNLWDNMMQKVINSLS